MTSTSATSRTWSYASAVRSKYPRARVLKIDTSKAEALPGVLGVLTAKDVPVNQVGHLIQDWDVFIAEGDITRFVGDAICLVVAEDTKTLERAKRLVQCLTTSPSSPCATSPRRKAPDAPIIHKSFNALGNLVELHDNVCQSRHVTRGNAKKALANSAHVVTHTFETPFTEHAFLEPECAVAIPYKDGVKSLLRPTRALTTRARKLPTCLAGTRPPSAWWSRPCSWAVALAARRTSLPSTFPRLPPTASSVR